MRYNATMNGPAVEPSGHRDAVFGLVERDGRVLLVSNPRVIGGARRDVWDLPGGAARGGETLVDALVREWREEVGLSVGVRELLLVVDGEKRTAAGALLYTWRAFVFRVASDGEPTPGEGITEAAWVPRKEAIARLDAPYHEHLRALLDDQGPRLPVAGSQPDAGRYHRLTWNDVAAGDAPDVDVPRRLLILAAAASVGDRDLLGREIRAAHDAGMAPARIVETLLQIVPYAGYPRAITAFGVLRADAAGCAAGVDRGRGGAQRVRRCVGTTRPSAAVYGETSAAVPSTDCLVALDPVLARWTLEHAYGRVLARAGCTADAPRARAAGRGDPHRARRARGSAARSHARLRAAGLRLPDGGRQRRSTACPPPCGRGRAGRRPAGCSRVAASQAAS